MLIRNKPYTIRAATAKERPSCTPPLTAIHKKRARRRFPVEAAAGADRPLGCLLRAG